jgi:hypothetical protein
VAEASSWNITVFDAAFAFFIDESSQPENLGETVGTIPLPPHVGRVGGRSGVVNEKWAKNVIFYDFDAFRRA